MTTRRELTQAVIEAARMVSVARDNRHFVYAKIDHLTALFCALDSCTEPDLAALDEAVAQAVEEYDRTLYRFEGEIRNALDARRAALKPKPRYRAAHNGVIIDDNLNIPMLAEEVAALLNAKEKP
jgi:hypothetical protein